MAAPFRVCVFCGARSGDDPRWIELARAFGAAAASRGFAIVYGGGGIGMMGALADGALSAGGEVIGVIPARLVQRELAHRGVRRMEIVADMAVRKQRMVAIANAFVALPGGLGTLDELFEVLTLRQVGEHDKPIVIVDAAGYWRPLLEACEALAAAGFVARRDLDAMQVATGVEGALDLLGASRRDPARERPTRRGQASG
ncbi:MAG: TIGR00730 family Rossman fold protein [Burkholderiaceae bacterium]|nr:TIGR00730 family Rossman fold protein [Burkholderiaceae bacterium]